MSSHTPIDPLVGTTVSQFEIVAKLGGGGMGVVYKARDLKLGRFVALKFLPPQWSHDENAKQRFIREAQAASATQHKSICTIHNIEEAPDGRLFIVMAYYEGETLKQRLERGPLPIGDAVQIGLEIAEGLAKAHGQGVVHRDIKPGNIILTDEGAKIVDFGLAKFADALQLTAPGTTIGTVAYMSPEQTRGEEADAQSDIWAWGIVMFAMLTGAPPFRGGYPEATFHAIKNEPLPPMRGARPEIPEAVEQVILPALEKDRAQRYASAREPARALRLLQGMTVPLDLRTQAVTAPSRAKVTAGRSSRLVTPGRVLAAAVTMVIVAAGVWFWTSRPVTRIPLAIVPLANHTGIPDLDRYRLALTEALSEELSESPNIRVVPYLRLLEAIRPFLVQDGDVSSSEAVQAIASSTSVPFLVVPALAYRDRNATWVMEVQVRNAATGTTMATYETAPVTSSLSEQTAFQLTAAAARSIQQHFKEHGPGKSFVSRDRPRLQNRDLALRFEAGLNAYEAGEYQRAAEAFAEAARLDDADWASWAWLARTLTVLGRRSEATQAAQRGRNAVARQGLERDVAFVEAISLESLDEASAGERAYRRLVELDRDDPASLLELADYLKRRQDQNQPAIDAYHTVLQRDPSYLRVHVDLCQLYSRLDDYPLADKEGNTALAGARAARNPLLQAQAQLCLAESQRRSRRNFSDARRLVLEARQLLDGLDAPFNLSRAVFNQANIEYSDGRLPDAARLFSDAANRLEEAGNRTLQATALMNLGITHYFSGRPNQALTIYARSEQAFREAGDERRAAEMEVNLSGLQVEYGIDLEQATRRVRNARANLEKMGRTDFQLGAMQIEAEASLFAGRIEEAHRLLRAALAIATDKGLTRKVRELSLSLANASVTAGDYGAALTLLKPYVEDGSSEAGLVLARALLELGDAPGAAQAVGRVKDTSGNTTNASWIPARENALGQIEREEHRPAEALAHFQRAVSSWSDSLVPAPVAEASCAGGSLEAELGHREGALASLEAGAADARRLSRLELIAVCSRERARVEIGGGNYAAGLAALRPVPDDDSQRALGRPLRASIEYWRARALDGIRDPAAMQQYEKARALWSALRDEVPQEYRERFEARSEVNAALHAMVRPTP